MLHPARMPLIPPPVAGRLARLLASRTGVSIDEARPAVVGGAALALTLGAHFMSVPLRDECGASVGQAALPVLFLASLPLTALAAPLVGGWLATAGAAGKGGPAVATLLRSLALVEALCCVALGATAAATPTPPRAPRVFYFTWRSAANAAALSAVWARVLASLGSWSGASSDGSATAARRLVGPLSAAATGGQLGGSAAVGVFAWCLVAWSRAGAGAGAPLPPALLALPAAGAAALLAAAAGVVASPELDGIDGGGSGGVGAAAAAAAAAEAGKGGDADARPAPSPPPAGSWLAVRTALGAAAADPLARALAALMAAAASVSAWAYLLKQAVVAHRGGSGGAGGGGGGATAAVLQAAAAVTASPSSSVATSAARMVWFASISASSAVAIAALQLGATGRALAVLPPEAALAAGPAVAALGFAATALLPAPGTVAVAEAARKATDYGLSRPARDAAFAALPPPVLFAARLALDALAPRAGDAAAAAGVGALRAAGVLQASPAPAAAAAVPVALLGVWAARRVGRAQARAALAREA